MSVVKTIVMEPTNFFGFAAYFRTCAPFCPIGNQMNMAGEDARPTNCISVAQASRLCASLFTRSSGHIFSPKFDDKRNTILIVIPKRADFTDDTDEPRKGDKYDSGP